MEQRHHDSQANVDAELDLRAPVEAFAPIDGPEIFCLEHGIYTLASTIKTEKPRTRAQLLM